ncbi:hypothetical protein BJ165DRAFT_1528873 [Panaeolus papilionaceus]|nr:hypothetical protein BJ165DRAFT_1528873 [Panaeolus papilionaceus]
MSIQSFVSLVSLGKKRSHSLLFYYNAVWTAFFNRPSPFHFLSTLSHYSTFTTGVKVFTSLISLGTRLQKLLSTNAINQAQGRNYSSQSAAGWLAVATSVSHTLEESTAQSQGITGTRFTVEGAQTQRQRGSEERQRCKPPLSQSTNVLDSEDKKPGSPPLPHRRNIPPPSQFQILIFDSTVTILQGDRCQQHDCNAASP